MKPSDKCASTVKKTRSQIQYECEKQNSGISVSIMGGSTQKKFCYQPKLEKNLNRVIRDIEIATNIDQTIAVLKIGDSNYPHLDK